MSVFDDVGACIDRLRRSGRLLGVVSASESTRYLLDNLGLASYFDVCVDGLDMAAAHLADRPSPAALLHCSGLLGVEPSHSAVLVSGPDGARAGRSGGYVEVVAVARPGDEPPDHDVAPLVDRVVASLDEVPEAGSPRPTTAAVPATCCGVDPAAARTADRW